MAKKTREEKVTKSSGNVFADLGFDNPEEELAKANLVMEIARVISAKQMTQAKIAKQIGIDQPQVSKLLRGITIGYTTDRLINILNRLEQDVEIKVTARIGRGKSLGRVFVTATGAAVPKKASKTAKGIDKSNQSVAAYASSKRK